MVLQSVTIKNFRSIFDETLECEALTALVGANGSGKSSFLRALDLFYNPAAKVDRDDFYNRETTAEISISLTFTNLSPEAAKLFQKYIQADTLTVERVFKWEDEKPVAKYHGSTLQNPAFAHIKADLNLKDGGKQAKESYKKIKVEAKYTSLPDAKTKTDILEALQSWEEANNGECVRERDDGQFFGFQSVAEGYLGKFTKFLFIPAIREASDDASENKGSPINILMDLVVRSVLANKDEIKNLRQDTQAEYEKVMAAGNLGELKILADTLTTTLKTFAPDASVDLLWRPLDPVSIPMPQADVRLVEDGYSSAVSRTGHGLQRAFILTMLQHLALAQATSRNTDNISSEEKTEAEVAQIPNFLIAIEEPELYQHPNRQRHLASILLKLSSGEIPGVAQNTQVLYCTHSPLFVGIDRIDQIRLLRKVKNDPAKPKVTQITTTKLSLIANELDILDGSKGTYTAATLIPRLQGIMTPMMNEGFFADAIALVEGEDDRASIIGMAKSMGYDLDSLGFAVIACGGKPSIDRPYLIFKKLGIPVYPLWDGDKGKKDADPPEVNKRLLRMLGQTEEEWPSSITDIFGCFEIDLEVTLKQELGDEIFDGCIAQCKVDFGMAKESQIKKNSNFYKKLIDDAKAKKVESASLKKIVESIIKLK